MIILRYILDNYVLPIITINIRTSQFRPRPQIDFEEYDESGAARQRWRDAVDAVEGTAEGAVRVMGAVVPS